MLFWLLKYQEWSWVGVFGDFVLFFCFGVFFCGKKSSRPLCVIAPGAVVVQ